MATKLKPVREGFTMIEMLITLLIVSSILVLVMVGSQRFSRSSLQTERAFWESFDGYWKQALYEAQYHGRSTDISIEKGVTDGFSNGTKKRNHWRYREEAIHPDQSEKLSIRSDGTTSPRTVIFKSDIDQRIYRLVIQMGWGVYHVDREKA